MSGSNYCELSGINNAGQIVGTYEDANAHYYGVLFDHGSYTTFNAPGTLDPGALGTSPTGINNLGQIVGSYSDATTSGGFLLDHGTYTGFFVPGSGNTYTTAHGINDSGDIVGSYRAFPGTHGLLIRDDAYTTIDAPDTSCIDPDTEATGINNSGQIVGFFLDDASTSHGFLLDHGSYTTIDVPGARSSNLQGINDAGQMVGSYGNGSNESHGFLLDHGSYTTLDVPGALATLAIGINKSGQIVGAYRDQNGYHGFLATRIITSIAVVPAQNQNATAGFANAFVLGSFSDSNPAAKSWSVDIDWGDGTAHTLFTAATTGLLGSQAHVYSQNGSYTVTVAVTDNLGAAGSGTFQVVVSVPTTTVVITAPANQTTTEGDSNALDLGSFSDANTAATSWSVAVHWGDGSADTTFTTTTPGVLTPKLHSYAEEGLYTITLEVTNNANATGSATFQANALDRAVIVTPANFGVLANSAFNGSVATFMDPGGAEAISDYSATIDWGDGSSPTAGTITIRGGAFQINAAHTYGQPGSFLTTVTVRHDVAAQTIVHGNAAVTGAGMTIVWSGAGGVDQNWSDPNNWVGKVVPGPGDTAVFNNTASNRNSTVDAAFAGVIGGLILDSTWEATLTVQTTLTITGSSTWASGFIYAGRAGLTNNGTLTVNGKDNKFLGGFLTNDGTIIHGVGGSIGFNGDATLVNNGLYDFQADGTGIFINTGSTATFINTGTVKKSAVTNPANRSSLHVSYFLNNGGSFDVETGRLALGDAQVVSTGMTVTVAGTDAVLDLTDGSTTTYSGSYGTGSGNGHIRLSNGTLVAGPNGATFSFPAGLLQWTGGYLSGGVAGLTNNGTLTVTGPNNKFLGGLFTNNGTMIQSTGPGSLGFNGDALLINNGTYDFQADGTGIFVNTGSSSSFFNNGTVKKSAGNGTVSVSLNFFDNQGTGVVNVQSGMLNLAVGGISTGTFVTASGTTLNFNGGSYTANTGTSFTGSGSLQIGGGTVVINGTVTAQNVAVASGTLNLNSDAVLNVAGTYVQTNGTLATYLVASSFGQLHIGGSATLGGVLAITLVGTYSPNVGDAFQILTFGSRTGNPPSDFGAEFGLNIGNGLRLNPVYNASSLTLLVVSQPAPPPGASPPNGNRSPVDLSSLVFPTSETVVLSQSVSPASYILGGYTPEHHRIDALFRLFEEIGGESRSWFFASPGVCVHGAPWPWG